MENLNALAKNLSVSICRRAAPSAEFSVDRHRHLMSFLTMLGPSPDWNVGLSAEDLCTKDCGWVQKVVQDLIPWDAGTDSGVTYEVFGWLAVHLTWIYLPEFTLSQWGMKASQSAVVLVVCLHAALLSLFLTMFMFSFFLQSPNKPTVPQEKIRPLTSLDHPQSPFYDPEGGSIKLVARVVIERIARKVQVYT